MSEQPSPLPPYPWKLNVAFLGMVAGLALVTLGYWGGIFGVESRGEWQPELGMGLMCGFLLYVQRATRRPFGPYAPSTAKQKAMAAFAIIAVVTVVVAPNALAH